MDDDDKGPPLKLVNENSKAEVDREWARARIRWPMKELAANLIRVTRGAGRVYDLPRQMVDVLEAMEAYRDVAGCYPSDYGLQQLCRFPALSCHRSAWMIL